MIYQEEMGINIMVIDATFWVAVSFVIFFGALIYLKIPQKISQILDKAQKKLDTAQTVSDEILEQAKRDSDKMVIELNDKFHKTSEIKKNLAENKISQMKEAAIKEIKDTSIKIAVDSVKKIITTSVDKSKLDALFQKNLDETKEELKEINS